MAGTRACRNAAARSDIGPSIRAERRHRPHSHGLPAALGVPVIEDAAEALGASFTKADAPGTFGDFGVSRSTETRSLRPAGGGMLGAPTTRRGERAEADDPGPRAGSALRTLRDRLQLPDEQPARRDRPGATSRLLRSRVPARDPTRVIRRLAGDEPGDGFMPDAAVGAAHALADDITVVPTCSAPIAAVRLALESQTSKPGRYGSPCTCSRCLPTPTVGGTVAERTVRSLALPSSARASLGFRPRAHRRGFRAHRDDPG